MHAVGKSYRAEGDALSERPVADLLKGTALFKFNSRKTAALVESIVAYLLYRLRHGDSTRHTRGAEDELGHIGVVYNAAE